MKAAHLLAMYERIADAPDAVARLRRFVLDLAVRGKLVPQNANDEPASEILCHLHRKRAVILATKGVRAKRPVSLLADANSRDLPVGWAIEALGNLVDPLATISYGVLVPGPDVDDGIPLIRAQDIALSDHPLRPQKLIAPEIEAAYARTRIRGGEILLCVVGSIGKLGIAPPSWAGANIARAVARIAPMAELSKDFVLLVLRSDLGQGYFSRATRTLAQPTLNVGLIETLPVPLPPLAEQHRIVAKVDELMALCDRLEAARTEREAKRDRLAAASLARLNTPDPETFPADASFALNTLPALTTRPDQIKALRQTILNLAVRGKLVPQDPSDEPISVDVRSMAAAPPGLPASWRYVRLERLLSEETRNGYARRPDDAPDGVPILRISAGTVRRDGVVAEEEHKLISGIDAKARDIYGLRSGDLLACRFNGNKAFVGRLAIFNDYLKLRPIYPDKLIRVRSNPCLAIAAFLRLASDSDQVRAGVEEFCATTVGNWGISASNLKEVRFPVPPLAEQHRIIAKVDELMALCDALEASLGEASTSRTRLLNALLADALSPDATGLMAAAQ